MIVCDTNILVEFYKGNSRIVSELRDIGQKQMAISAITQGELCFGALNKSEMKKIMRHLALLNIIPLDTTISEKFSRLMEKYSLSHKLAIPDALIAATSLVYEKDLYTLNIKDFQFIEGLELYIPSASNDA